MGIASLILGILAILISLLSAGGLGWLGCIMSAVGIILGGLGCRNPEEKGISIAGLVVSIIAFLISILLFAACKVIVGVFKTIFNAIF